MKTKSIGHIISHTHWDREWRVPEWNSRWRLKVMIDKLLDKLEEQPELCFLFDGQVVGIHDYLEICPDRRQEVEGYIKSGQLQVGPWYNLPDLYPVCGEALIRNLLCGMLEAKKLGKCLSIGYTTFGWGQTAQFPQIFKGFGIDQVVCGKNVSKERAPHSEFHWESPDGSVVFSTRLGEEKRANFFFTVVMPVIYGQKYMDDKTRVEWGKEGWFFHSADSFTDSEPTFIPEDTFHPDLIEESLKEAWKSCKDSLVQKHLFMGNGCDSTAPHDVVEKILKYTGEKVSDKELIYSTLENYLKSIRQVIKDENLELKTVYGELRDGPVHALSANALATRMPLKVLNRKAQDQLIRYAEPLTVFAGRLGLDFPGELLEKAWDYLLLAHSHDAINGVTLDKTAEDTAHKLKQVIEISQVLSDMAAMEILKRVNLSDYDGEDILMAVFNPTPSPKKQIVQVIVDVPEEKRCRQLKAFDSESRELKVQNMGHKYHAAPVYVQNSRALPFYSDRHTLVLSTGEIPAYGYKIIKLVPVEPYNEKLKFWHGTYEQGSQLAGPLCMENSYLRVEVNPDGTYNLHCKSTGQKFKNLGYFEDGGDVGDYWQRVKPAYDQLICSKGKEAHIYLKEDGPLQTTFVCQLSLQVPSHAVAHHKFDSARAGTMQEVNIHTELTLKADSPILEVKVRVNNQAKDHRLRLALPTFIQTDQSHAMGHFHVDTRPIGREYQDGFRDGEMSTLPMQNFIDLSAGASGLAILNKDLLEFEVSEDESRTVHLTLLRCVEVNICTEGRCATVETGADGGQCLGEHTFHYALHPHKGDWIDGRVYETTEGYLYPPRIYQTSKHENGSLPVDLSFFSIESPFIQLSSVKRAEDHSGIIIRIYNTLSEKLSTRIHMAHMPDEVYRTKLNEEIEESLPVDVGGFIALEAGAHQIITLLFNYNNDK